jgi:hypothetical protein
MAQSRTRSADSVEDRQSGKKGIKIPMIFLPIYLPLFLLAAAMSIPLTRIFRIKQGFDEKKFVEAMNKSDRLMTWQEFRQAIESGKGTAIGEYLSPKGPFRLWWTAEDIPATCPHAWKRQTDFPVMEPEFLPFFEWCFARYTNPELGMAQLVPVPGEERKQLGTTLISMRFVSTCSFRSIREGHSLKIGPD